MLTKPIVDLPVSDLYHVFSATWKTHNIDDVFRLIRCFISLKRKLMMLMLKLGTVGDCWTGFIAVTF